MDVMRKVAARLAHCNAASGTMWGRRLLEFGTAPVTVGPCAEGDHWFVIDDDACMYCGESC